MRWIFPDSPDAKCTKALADALRIPYAIAELLRRRGFQTPEEARPYLQPKLASLADPFLLPDMERAVERILHAIDVQERIVVYGDYDVDGVSSLALLSKVLQAFGAHVRCFLPTRQGEGYGLSRDGLERCRQTLHPQLLIAVDCGTSSVQEIADLGKEGVEVVVLDHHECPAELPNCVALVNPKRGEHFRYLCSVGIVFKLAHALLKRRKIEGVDLREYLDFVALGTLADLVPLHSENRVLVRKGLHQLGQTRWVGIRALMDVAGVKPPLEAGDVGFKLGPRMNAAGRLGTAQDAFELLVTEDEEKARTIAEALDLQNRDRRAVEDQVFQEAEKQIGDLYRADRDAAIVVGGEGWHPGVVGIVASRIMRRYHRPTFVVGFDESGSGKGSGRSIRGLSLVEALEGCRESLHRFGGHEMAAGITVPRDRFEAFREAFGEIARQKLDAEKLQPRLEIDAECWLEEINAQMLEQYEALAPFGMGNPQPLFALRGVTPAAQPRLLKEKHMQLSIRQGRASARAIWFNAPTEPLPPAPWDIAFELARNEYQGTVSAQVLVRAIRTAQ
ncbi:MAG: Single-stranded-DNA-specific exonuclease RecJ [Verrucomicrobiota bacterium]|jgi:single-stranded-DNA-specific exonuclease